MEQRGSVFRSIAAEAGSFGSASFYVVLPMRTKKDGPFIKIMDKGQPTRDKNTIRSHTTNHKIATVRHIPVTKVWNNGLVISNTSNCDNAIRHSYI